MKSKRAKSLHEKAREIAQDDKKLHKLAQEALHKAHRHREKIPGFWIDLKVLVRLVKAWARREYRVMPWKSLLAIVGAILYFLNPFDLVPDFLLFGFLDDAFVIAKVIGALKGDLDRFLAWEKTIEVLPLHEGSPSLH